MEYLKTLLDQLRNAQDLSRDRVRSVAWAKHGTCSELVLSEGMDIRLLIGELEEVLQNAARWQAIVDTGRAIFEEQ